MRCKAELTAQRHKTEDPVKLAALDQELRTLGDQMKKAREDERRIMDLGLRGAPPTKPVDLDAEAAEAVRGSGGKGSLLDKVKKADGQDSK